MRCRALGNWPVWLSAWAVLLSTSSALHGQNNNVSSTGSTSGIAVDANGVLRMQVVSDTGGQLMRERVAAAKAALNPALRAYSKLRKISLNRLEHAVIDRQGALSDEMRYLAGLLRVRYVFYYPETKDIVLAGPAEGWATDPVWRVVGISSGQPVVQLQDLIAALRAFPPKGEGVSMIGCSIDPTPEGLAAMQRFLRSTGSQATPAATAQIVDGLRTSLGYQKVSIHGVSPRTHYAQVMVEADYRMKLIGIGLEQPPVRLVSYVDRARPGDVARNALQRWFFTPNYQCLRVADDQLAMELVGDGVKLVGEDEMVASGGERHVAIRANKASQAFVLGFTKQYAELAARSPVYAELRNLIDLAIAAAYLHEHEYYAKAGWYMEYFGNERAFSIETCNIPQTVETAVNAVWKGSTLMTPVGGGVNIRPAQALDLDNLLGDKNGAVSKLRESTAPKLEPGQWWWD
jgi:hypothetical protein